LLEEGLNIIQLVPAPKFEQADCLPG